MKRRVHASSVDLTKSFNDEESNPANNEILVTVRKWGNAAFVFPELLERADWRDPENTLWQARIYHDARQSLGYMLLDNATEALKSHPDPKTRNLKNLEINKHIKILTGAPPTSGQADPHGMDYVPWQPVIYGKGQNPAGILELIGHIVEHQHTCGKWSGTPPLVIRTNEWPWPDPPPAPWQLRCHPNMNQLACFRALPPLTRQHVLCQLNRCNTEKSTYILTFYGNLYPYRMLFNKEQIPAGMAPPDKENAENVKPVYVRQLSIDFNTVGQQAVLNVLVNVLCNLPVFFIDATDEPDDEFAAWMVRQDNVILGECHF